MAKIVIALGGNALGNSPQEQLEKVKTTAKAIALLAKEKHKIAIVHGNGPQVGMIYNAFASASINSKDIPEMPFPEAGAMSQGYIGYQLQQAIQNELIKQKIACNTLTIVTQTIVDKKDPRFGSPSKPIGNFMTEVVAKQLAKQNGYAVKEDAGRGWRRVIASPLPIGFVETKEIEKLFAANTIVICAGGGGVPVYIEKNKAIGIPAVVDKDFAAAKLSELIKADKLIILTAVDAIKINYNKPNQKTLKNVTIHELNHYISENQFAPGSMLPKVQACISFAKTGKSAYIGQLENSIKIIQEKSGTKITK